MEVDYPAAHSMDSTWFAVDARGQVGIFETGENGPLPDCFDPQEVYSTAVLPDAAGTYLGLEEEIALLTARGFYLFDYWGPEEAGYFPAGLYLRSHQPRQPLHVGQLPPQVRQLVSRLKLTSRDFASDEVIQPLEHTLCQFWPDFTAYLASDQVTIRPCPGREDSFDEFLAAFQKECPAEFARFRFEHPKPRPKRGKGKTGG